jgi:predicted esterase
MREQNDRSSVVLSADVVSTQKRTPVMHVTSSRIRQPTVIRVILVGILLLLPSATIAEDELKEAPDIREVKAGEPAGIFTIAGLPQHSYSFDVKYENGELTPLQGLGTVGFVIRPKGAVHSERRWLWVSNLFLAVRWEKNGVIHQFTVEQALKHGFHVVGLDIGTSLGSPAGAELYDRFHKFVVERYKLNQRACMLGHSNGGLITLGFAFRHPESVERILGIFPATDFRSWPGFDRVTGKGRITPVGLAYDLDAPMLLTRIREFNPIDNLEPLAKAKIPLYHIHGTADETVPLQPNSEELARRYRALGGRIQLEIIPGGKHGGREFYTSQAAADFITQ